MAVATLMIGFKFEKREAFFHHLKEQYYLNNGLTKNPNQYTSDNSSNDYYQYNVFKGSIYENWYGWTDEQKRHAYLELWNRHTGFLQTACHWFCNNDVIRTINRSSTAQHIIVGIPLIEVVDNNNNYKCIVSETSTSSSDSVYQTLQLDKDQITKFKTLVSYLKMQNNKPQLFMFNAEDSNNWSFDDRNIWLS